MLITKLPFRQQWLHKEIAPKISDCKILIQDHCKFCGIPYVKINKRQLTCGKRECVAKRVKERQYELKSLGLCVQCGKSELVLNHTKCQICLDKFKEHGKKSRIKNGEKRRTIICSNCNESKKHKAKGLCLKCYEKQKRYK